jgi:hypothetical protein
MLWRWRPEAFSFRNQHRINGQIYEASNRDNVASNCFPQAMIFSVHPWPKIEKGLE